MREAVNTLQTRLQRIVEEGKKVSQAGQGPRSPPRGSS
jgi:hypothetical protein